MIRSYGTFSEKTSLKKASGVGSGSSYVLNAEIHRLRQIQRQAKFLQSRTKFMTQCQEINQNWIG